MDWFVILAPLLALGVVALLGFAGCLEFEPLPPTLTLRALVPTTLTIIRAEFSWLAPGSTVFETDSAPDFRVVGTETVLEHVFPPPRVAGTWEVVCTVEVREGATPAEDTATGIFVVDAMSPLDAVALFDTSGSPTSSPPFDVQFVALTE